MFKKLFVFGVLFLTSFEALAKIVEFDSFKLDNGLEVVVVSNHKAPVGLVKLYYKAGSVNDPMFKGGIAHLLEHLMFRGTKRVKDKEFNLITEVNGAENNAYTTFLHTGYYEFSDISKLELMLALEADRMENLEINDEVFLKEREVVLEERMQRFETNVATKFYEKSEKIFWDKHPYSRPVSGEIEEIKNLKKEDAIEFYEKYYSPANCVLVLAGDIKLNEAKALANKYFGKIKNKNKDIEELEIIEPEGGKFEFEMNVEGILQNRFVSYLYLPKNAIDKKEELALEFWSQYLAGDDTAYLFDELVYKNKKFISLGVGVDYDEKMGGRVVISAVPVDDDMKTDEFEKLVFEYIEKGMSVISSDKIEKIKNENLSNAVYLIEEPVGVANFVGGLKLKNYSDDEIKKYDEMIKGVGLDDVVKVYEKVFKGDYRKVLGKLGKK